MEYREKKQQIISSSITAHLPWEEFINKLFHLYIIYD